MGPTGHVLSIQVLERSMSIDLGFILFGSEHVVSSRGLLSKGSSARELDARDLAPTRAVVWLLAYISIWGRHEREKAKLRSIDVANEVTQGRIKHGAGERYRGGGWVVLAGNDGSCRRAYRFRGRCEVVDSVGERWHIDVTRETTFTALDNVWPVRRPGLVQMGSLHTFLGATYTMITRPQPEFSLFCTATIRSLTSSSRTGVTPAAINVQVPTLSWLSIQGLSLIDMFPVPHGHVSSTPVRGT